MANVTPKVNVQVLELPTSLVLIENPYDIFLQIQNTSQNTGPFKILYEGTGLQVKSSDLMGKELVLTPNSSEMDRIEFIPFQKGLISLNIKIIYLKEIIKKIERVIQPPAPSLAEIPPPAITDEEELIDVPSETKDQESSEESSIFEKEFSPEISQTLEEVLSEPEPLSEPKISTEAPPIPPPPPEPQVIIEKIKEIIEEEIYSTSIYLNALDKQSTKGLKEFAKKGDSNIFSSEMGLPLCICYFYSEDQKSKWKIRPALIRNICIRLKDKFEKFCYYLSYPLSKHFTEKEIPIIQEAIQTFILPQSSSSHSFLIVNLDIIPELEKPSIIIGYEKSGTYEPIKSLLQDIFGNSIDIFVDDCIFSGGLLYNYLVNWAGPSKARVLNMVLSNNFIENIDMFQNLLESLASLSLGEL